MRLVPTPGFRVSVLTQRELTKSISDELKTKCWTDKCTELLQLCALTIFEFDRQRHTFGINNLDLLFLNPWMTFCPYCNT